jgi:hypothetical protein
MHAGLVPPPGKFTPYCVAFTDDSTLPSLIKVPRESLTPALFEMIVPTC